MKRFEDRVAVVTGGSSGLGLGIARGLREEGARVVVSGRAGHMATAVNRLLL